MRITGIPAWDVPEEERLDTDSGPGATAGKRDADTADLQLYRTVLRGEVIEEDLG